MLKQTIFLATHINESEKLKSLAVFNHKTINNHYYTALELAKYLLQLSGVVLTKKFISNEEVGARLYTSIKEIDYFKKFSFNDVLDLIRSITDLRRYIVDDEEASINRLPLDAFPQKNNAIKEAYRLSEKQLLSGFDFIFVWKLNRTYEEAKFQSIVQDLHKCFKKEKLWIEED